jgi:hypothetical protein
MNMAIQNAARLTIAALFVISATTSEAGDRNLYLTEYTAPTTTVRSGFVPYKAQPVWGEPLQVTFSVENGCSLAPYLIIGPEGIPIEVAAGHV